MILNNPFDDIGIYRFLLLTLQYFCEFNELPSAELLIIYLQNDYNENNILKCLYDTGGNVAKISFHYFHFPPSAGCLYQ